MGKKSKAQLKRLELRAHARGEVYIPPSSAPETSLSENHNDNTDHAKSVSTGNGRLSSNAPSDESKLNAMIQLRKDISAIETNNDMKAKERRSAKRKAEAIAVESCDCLTVEELRQWYEEFGKCLEEEQNLLQSSKPHQDDTLVIEKNRTNPLILFIGQLSYDTTKDDLFQHIKKNLKKDHTITESNLKIRLLQDMNTKKSRGMAFVEVLSNDPEHMYALLKLHRTFLKGRRINVERSSGGGVQTRKMKIQQHRMEQEQFIDGTVMTMLQEYFDRGEIQRIGELDNGVVQLCKRHSTTVVQAALERYVESNGRDMNNPSAYLSFLLTKLAEEGIFNTRETPSKPEQKDSSTKNAKGSGSVSRTKPSFMDKTQSPERKRYKPDRSALEDSELAKDGVNMTASIGKCELVKIFPSLSRGRGRGRGYM